MAKREAKKDVVINELVSKLYSIIRSMEEGSETSIGRLVARILMSRGYENHWLDGKHGNGWTKDGGKTFAITDEDLFDILDKTDIALKDDVELDFSKYENMIVGLPYCLEFTVRHKK